MINYEEMLRLLLLEIQKRGWNMKRFAKEMRKTSTWASQVFKGKIQPDKTRIKTPLTVPMLLEIFEILKIEPSSLFTNAQKQKTSILTLDDFIRDICREEIKNSIGERS